MKKYDCSKTEDFLEVFRHMTSNSKSMIIYGSNGTKTFVIDESNNTTIDFAQEYADKYLNIYTDQEIDIAKAVRILLPNYKYVCQDKKHNVYATLERPFVNNKGENCGWDFDASFGKNLKGAVKVSLFPYTDNWDESLINIDDALKLNKKNNL